MRLSRASASGAGAALISHSPHPRASLPSSSSSCAPRRVLARASETPDAPEDAERKPSGAQAKGGEIGLGLKATWVAAELLGDATAALGGGGSGDGANKQQQTTTQQQRSAASGAVRTVEEIVQSIRGDYDLDYFISGAAEMEAYADDCLFSDDFASFQGAGSLGRFRKNVKNLGGALSDVRIDVESDWAVVDNRLTTSWRFQGIVGGLPWRPMLAAAGTTTHVIDPERGVVVEHLERWKSKPGEVVARLFRPARTPPGNGWEAFMLAASAGDAKGIWMLMSPKTIPVSLLIGAAALTSRLVAGHGVLPSWLEVAAAVALPAAVVTEILKFSGGLQGGETGTGGRF